MKQKKNICQNLKILVQVLVLFLGKSDGPKWISNFVKKKNGVALQFMVVWVLLPIGESASGRVCVSCRRLGCGRCFTIHNTTLYCTVRVHSFTALNCTTLLCCTYCTVLQYFEVNCTLLIYTAAASLPSGGQL